MSACIPQKSGHSMARRISISHTKGMATAKRTNGGTGYENRTRSTHIVLRVNDAEREMMERVAARLHLNLSEALRWLIRQADQQK